MATALQHTYHDPAVCKHEDGLNPYETIGGDLDPMIEIKGRCPLCDGWFRHAIDFATQSDSFTPLDNAEIARLRRSVWT